MNSIIRFVVLVAGFALLIQITPSWGQTPTCASPGCNPTASDANRNSAGGTNALLNVSPVNCLIGGGGCDNTAFGFQALESNAVGSGNTATGGQALRGNNGGGSLNTATGYQALKNNNGGGSSNTATGAQALGSNSGNFNTATGAQALQTNASGAANTATGAQALRSNLSGNDNTATGWGALENNIDGSQNTASGVSALADNKFGSFNTATGFAALTSNLLGVSNTASGYQALFVNTRGDLNTANGYQALVNNVDGDKNSALGSKALFNSTGNKNIGIGFMAGATLTSGNNNIFIGNQGVGDESQTIRIGTEQARTFIAGIGNASVMGVPVEVDTTTGQLGIATSSVRYKQDVAPIGMRSEKVLDLRPVTFAYRNDTQGMTHYGLIAEEVAAVYPELVTRTATGEVQTVKYQELIPMLLNELQRQRQEFQQALQGQERELAALRALVEAASPR